MSFEEVVRKRHYGTFPLITLHVYEHVHGEMHTYCGMSVKIWTKQEDHFASAQDLFGERPLWGDEVMCPACAATARYQEMLAWYTLGGLP